ncbi:MAG TPA: hypothetical protein PKL54_02590 [Candidatus Hydrogenedentes bacterium]|nr:hypothetical protein [Candidatus Hydrogenedentota bacterium]HOC71671.1 hypothetical protein [Candidatus Hydrogenedentota bacterium]HOH51151.1 hypothetical protein [Candidatus Hydrogenedentota bacterium]HPA41962.1 hypothetical protein [Candidatus Hydrogenedentota bacterium]HQL93476.1 hypothetical protein [Candidatus Hydrogenedentota bacterium]
MKTLVILGACGTSREAWWVLWELDPEIRAVFVDDVTGRSALDLGGREVPVVQDWNFDGVRESLGDGDPDSFREFVCGMGDPRVKRIVVEKALRAGLRPAPTVVAKGVYLCPTIRVGRGGFIHRNSAFTADITLGDYVTVHTATMGHDAVVGDYCTLGACSLLTGHTRLGEGVFLGCGSVVRPRTQIAAWVTVGINAAVVRDVTEEGVTIAGVPARILKPKAPQAGEGCAAPPPDDTPAPLCRMEEDGADHGHDPL